MNTRQRPALIATLFLGLVILSLLISVNVSSSMKFQQPTEEPAAATMRYLVEGSVTALAQTALAQTAQAQAELTGTPSPSILSTPVETNSQWVPIAREFNGVEMVLVPPGCFEMGEDGAGGEQCFDEPFWIDKYEVTNAEYRRCGESEDGEPCPEPGDRDEYENANYADYPIRNISWRDANTYAEWRECRLPTEAEWEYALRGVDNVEEMENPGDEDGPSEVGSRRNVSWVGAHDMIGNVSEWTSTRYYPYPYTPDPTRENPDTSEAEHVSRGYSYGDYHGEVDTVGRAPGFHGSGFTGFRCARDYQPGDLDAPEGD